MITECGRCGGTGNDPDTSRDDAPPECRRCDGDGIEPTEGNDCND